MSILFATILNKCTRFMQERLPQSCVLCGLRAQGGLLCVGCREDLPTLPEPQCPQCALPSLEGGLCGHCLKHHPRFDRTLAARAYGFPLDALVQAFKYQHRLELADLFAGLMAEQAERAGKARQRPLPDLLIPMPLHPERTAERGYNQAAEVARRLSARLGVAWDGDACQRIRPTAAQAGLDLPERRRNLRGAFGCGRDLTGLRVALVDDVMTTGSSLNELAGVVRRAGAAEVEAWVLARTLSWKG